MSTSSFQEAHSENQVYIINHDKLLTTDFTEPSVRQVVFSGTHSHSFEVSASQ